MNVQQTIHGQSGRASCKTDYGQEEAIAVFGHDPRVYQTTVTEFIADKKGNVCKAKIVKLKPQKDEKTGRMMMVPVEGTEEVIPAEVVLIAAGFLGSQKYVTDAFKVNITWPYKCRDKTGSI